jgi:hypothetical protein
MEIRTPYFQRMQFLPGGRHWPWQTIAAQLLIRIEMGAGIVRDILFGGARKHRFHLGLQRGGVERLDDVVVDPGLLRGNDVLGL